ncbi:iron transporter [Campylobacter pinnipediorum]|uniref:Iron transporter n=1 Tax=Campylobacter pinnipediorum subsp. pinnipediorum TaxID=1660067 RepID=A0AAX0LCB7_9BACT|nr:iron transporter [Campylobacter pinnipediorum]AQW80430.1 ferrirhodotorulic acid ABC transporter, periplasmic binding protein [Campylobacter pinnipediorum subsp. pinnipediorum]AQW82100.1 ferrirhodotorulic acid ABC transporter, periplasmic binding protein [Campylobacter pinnipediorum subsp. pinnipediorum]AQW83778.1 ferrirhodotorulic acid ABC transporter, periplasmic binding protein [Campylobacter pinnipediorum subsp. pinnipediorum]OPA82156.1 iron transporter [Campylobacter pinnipediorum subsp.
MNKFLSSALAVGLFGTLSMAGEFPIGEPVEINGMEIAAVYLQPVDMEPKGMDLAPSQADIHLEADIHAIKGNKNGFGEGEWMPYLKIAYELKNLDNGKMKKGTFMPMVASDGPHYGANLKMDAGIGNYELKFHIDNPEKQGFGRHADKETGVGKWFEAFDVTYNFKWTGGPVK